MIGLGTKIAGGVAIAAVAVSIGLGLLYRAEVRESAVLRSANKTNTETIARLEADAAIAEAVAIVDAQARRELENETDALKKAAADAPDGDCPGLRALIERRRLQRPSDGNPPR